MLQSNTIYISADLHPTLREFSSLVLQSEGFGLLWEYHSIYAATHGREEFWEKKAQILQTLHRD